MMFFDNDDDDHDFFAITPARTRSPLTIYKQALQVFAADWRTFLICSSLKLAATVGYINVQLRILVLFTTGRTAASSLVTSLTRMSDREQFLLFFVWFCSTLVFLVISSAIQASTVRAVTNVYTGVQSSSYRLDARSIGRLFYFQLALWNACGLALLLTAGVVLICLANPEMSYVSWYSLAVIILLSLDIIKDVNAVMISMASCLIVEQQQTSSLMDAAKSCWRLCKDSLWRINLTLLGMIVMELVIDMGAMVFRNDVSRMDILLAACGTLVSLSCLPFNMIIGTVIYVSLRIEKDGLTQDGLIQELRGVAARNNNEGVVLDEDPLFLRKRLLDDVDNSVV